MTQETENQFAREIVTYGWFGLILASGTLTALWAVDVIPDNLGLYAFGWFSASFASIASLIVSRLLRPATE